MFSFYSSGFSKEEVAPLMWEAHIKKGFRKQSEIKGTRNWVEEVCSYRSVFLGHPRAGADAVVGELKTKLK